MAGHSASSNHYLRQRARAFSSCDQHLNPTLVILWHIIKICYWSYVRWFLLALMLL